MLFIFFALYSACALHQAPELPEVPSGQVIIKNQAVDEVQCFVEYRVYDPECSGVDYCSFYYDRNSELRVLAQIEQGTTAFLGLPAFWPLMEHVTYRGIGYVEVACVEDWGKFEEYYFFAQADFPYAGVLYCEMRVGELACYLQGLERREMTIPQLYQFRQE